MNIEQKYQAPIEIVSEFKKNVAWQKYSDMRMKKGHLLFQFSLLSGVLEQVNLNQSPVQIKNNPMPMIGKGEVLITPVELVTLHRTIKIQEDCIYLSCLNMMSAIKKIKKITGLTKFDKL